MRKIKTRYPRTSLLSAFYPSPLKLQGSAVHLCVCVYVWVGGDWSSSNAKRWVADPQKRVACVEIPLKSSCTPRAVEWRGGDGNRAKPKSTQKAPLVRQPHQTQAYLVCLALVEFVGELVDSTTRTRVVTRSGYQPKRRVTMDCSTKRRYRKQKHLRPLTITKWKINP